MRFALNDPMLVPARVEGQGGIVRELSAVIDFNSPYCVILKQDALDMGYPGAVHRHIDVERLHPDMVFKFACLESIQRGIVVRLPTVSVGPLSARNVDAVFLELEHPRFITFDFMLGRTFLNNFRLTVDGKKGYVSLL